jgi:phosphoribosylglycinamide formyltransferase-1
MKIGIFSTFIEPDALKLVEDVHGAVKRGEIPNSEISFVFSNRFPGENDMTDTLLQNIQHLDIPLIAFSAAQFKPEMRREARQKEREGNGQMIREWRNLYGEQVLADTPETDLDLLLGDMWIWGDNMCDARNGINLHPALPDGPKGEWYKVIWELIREGRNETGVMMHKVTTDLDRGPAVAYTRFPIRGFDFNRLWNELPKNEEDRRILIEEGLSQKELATHPLFRTIRDFGFIREVPLIIQTTKAFAEGSLRIEGGVPVDRAGSVLGEGFDLTKRIDSIVRSELEGMFGKERRR